MIQADMNIVLPEIILAVFAMAALIVSEYVSRKVADRIAGK